MKTHQLKQSWEAQDYAIAAQQSAKTAQQYHQLIEQNAQAIEVRFATDEQKIRLLEQTVQRLETEVWSGKQSDRTHCLIWGIAGALLTSCVMSLVTAPYNPPAYQQSTIMRSK